MDPDLERRIRQFAQAVVEAPPYLHLTSEKDHETFYERHALDAVAIHSLLPGTHKGKAAKVADIGTGNGVPGVVLAMMEPAWDITLIDSDSKKALIIDTFCNNLAIRNAHMVTARIEEFIRESGRGSFDLVFARAVGKLPMVLELASPFLKVGGQLIVPHGTSWNEEWHRSQQAARLLQLKLLNTTPYMIQDHHFILATFLQQQPCPDRYPRRFAQIKKKPL